MTLASHTSIPIYPQFDFADRSLTDLPNLLDGGWVWQEYRARFGDEWDSAPHRFRVRQFSHDPGRRAVVSYVAEWDPEEFIPDEQFAVELRRGKAASLYRYPDDPHLPGLNEAASVESALRLVNRHVLSIPARRARVDMVRYRPGNRAVLRHRIGRVRFYVRVLRLEALAPQLRSMELARRSGFVTPRLAGLWRDGGIIWMSEIPGKNMRRLIRRGSRPNPETLLDGLAKLWDAPMRDTDARPFNLSGAYLRAKRAFVNVLDEETAQRALNDAVRVLDPFVESWRPSHIAHNDFYDDQMLLLPDGRAALVDLESVGPGDAMLDVGNFLAHLRWGAHFAGKKDAEFKASYRIIFRQAALERCGWDERELALREAVCLFRICTNAIRHPQSDWRRRLKEGLTLVNDIVG